jgi:hypothetical protein
MIDLDDQLAAYGNYLDDAERSVTVLHPRAVAIRIVPRRRFVAGVAAALVLAGGAAVATVRIGDDGRVGIGSTDSDWTVVPDPEGVFVPPRDATTDGAADSDNTTVVNSVVATRDGFVAVGSETNGPASFGVVWRSPDGLTWSRVGDPSFGGAGTSGDTGTDGPTLDDVAEHDGRLVVTGGRSADGRGAQIWVTDDFDTWRTVPISDEDTRLNAVAGGHGRFVVVGAQLPSVTEGAETARVWVSDDGLSWQEATFEDAWGSTLYDVIAVDGGFVAAGQAGSVAAAWASVDGTSWQRADIEPTEPQRPQSAIHVLAARDGTIVGLGFALDQGPGQPGRGQITAWRTDDGRSWTWAFPVVESGDIDGPVVATDDGFVALASIYSPDRVRAIELRSEDGVTWTTGEVEAEQLEWGIRRGLAYRNGVVVAVGDAARGSSVWIRSTN